MDDYGIIYKKIEAQDKIINTQALEIARLKDKNKHIEQLWKETNVIIRNEKTLAVNDNAMNYIESLEQKIDKAIEYIDNNSYEETYTDENGITWLRFKLDNVNDLKDILSGEKK